MKIEAFHSEPRSSIPKTQSSAVGQTVPVAWKDTEARGTVETKPRNVLSVGLSALVKITLETAA